MHRVCFHEHDRKAGYGKKMKNDTTKSLKEQLKEGFREVGPELRKFKDEINDAAAADKLNWGPCVEDHGSYEILWKFDHSSATDDWVVTADSDFDEGKSSAKFEMTEGKKALFHGNICHEVPKDGIIKNAGYVNIRSPRNMKFFKSNWKYDWSPFSHLIFRVRGDGRPYQILLNTPGYFDIEWHDMYQFPLYTRGGPYWQTVKVPFSKFFFTFKGRISNHQERIPLHCIDYLGITLSDGVDGPFALEVDYIAAVLDWNHKEHFAYELYECDPSANY